MNPRTLNCRACGAPLGAGDLDEARGVAGEHGPDQRLYTVQVLTRDGLRLPLVRGMIHELDQALFFEQALEERLRIPDRPVGGEVSRG